MKKYQIFCPYCGSAAQLRPASTVHGEQTFSAGSYLYLCSRWPVCDSYVSAHRRNLRPMGTLANGELRHKRIVAHRELERFRKKQGMETWAVYLWLQGALGLSEAQTHIALFSEDRCEQVISLCKKARKTADAAKKQAA